MNITAHYSFTGAVPEEGWYFCMYVSMLGECSFAMAQVEFDIAKHANVWRKPEFVGMEVQEVHTRPYCYFTFQGKLEADTMLAMQNQGQLLFKLAEK